MFVCFLNILFARSFRGKQGASPLNAIRLRATLHNEEPEQFRAVIQEFEDYIMGNINTIDKKIILKAYNVMKNYNVIEARDQESIKDKQESIKDKQEIIKAMQESIKAKDGVIKRLEEDYLRSKGMFTSRGIFEYMLKEVHAELSAERTKGIGSKFNATDVCIYLDNHANDVFSGLQFIFAIKFYN